MRLCKGWQFENFGGSLLRGFNRKGPQSRKKAVNLVQGDPLAAMRHEKDIAHFVEPQDGNQGTLFRKAGQDAETVFPVSLIPQGTIGAPMSRSAMGTAMKSARVWT